MKRPLMAVCACFVALMAVLLWTDSPDSAMLPCLKGRENCLEEAVADLDGRVVTVTGRVYRKDTRYFYLDSILIQNQAAGQQQSFSLNENLICEHEGEAVRIGSNVSVVGTFSCFLSATNPGEFDSAQYYRSIGIAGKLKKLTVLKQDGSYSVWQEALYELRQYFRARLYQIFPEKEASVMTAMLLGDKSDLDEETRQLYQENGIIHILSISGLHISIIGMSIYRWLRRVGVPMWAAAMVGSGILLLYGVMTGMSISACRAIGMFLIKMLAEITGRTYDMLTALGIMAAEMVGNNFYYLQNAGFLLSYGAILGLGVLFPALSQREEKEEIMLYEERRWKQMVAGLWKKAREGLRQSMLSGLSVTLTTLPIMLWFYYEVPTYSVFLNLLVLPFMTMVMLSGLLAMLIPGLGVVGTVDYLVLRGYEWLCRIFEQLPFSKWNPGRPEGWQIFFYYGLLLMIVVFGWRREAARKLAQFGRYMVLTIAVILLGIHYPKETTVTFLDVGQGDCICVQLASGEVYLFDCGSTSRSRVGEYVLRPYLKYQGIGYIDAVFVSHPDKDHCNGIEELFAYGEEWGITVGELILPDAPTLHKELQELAEAAESAAQKQPITVSKVKAGDYWEDKSGRFLCLHPGSNCTLEDSNACSQCFYIELSQGMKLLLTGDVEAGGEDLLLEQLQERGIVDITVLKVAHHGSKYATKEELLWQIQPKAAIISCGRSNSYGHPHEETLQRLQNIGSKVFSTPQYGAVTVKVGKEIAVYGFKG